MSTVEQAYETQLRNIEKKTGKTLPELTAIIHNSGLTKHGEIREMLKREFGLGHGDANALTGYALKSDGEGVAENQDLKEEDVLSEIYSGPKSSLRPIHDRLMEDIHKFGEFETSPKKGYVSLRRKKQFAMIGPATNTRLEVGINSKTLAPHPRLIELPPGNMCNFKVRISELSEVDDELIGWIRQAFESAG